MLKEKKRSLGYIPALFRGCGIDADGGQWRHGTLRISIRRGGLRPNQLQQRFFRAIEPTATPPTCLGPRTHVMLVLGGHFLSSTRHLARSKVSEPKKRLQWCKRGGNGGKKPRGHELRHALEFETSHGPIRPRNGSPTPGLLHHIRLPQAKPLC